MGSNRDSDGRNRPAHLQFVRRSRVDVVRFQTGRLIQSPFRSTEFYEIMDMLDKRLNDKGKNWRHVLKALKVLDYCLHEGSELVVTWGKQNIYIIKTLREFMYVDEEGRDVGQNSKRFSPPAASLGSN